MGVQHGEFNRDLKCKQCPLPLIQEVGHWQSGHKIFRQINPTKMHHAFELDDESKELCTGIFLRASFSRAWTLPGSKVTDTAK
jgi:hypothetical protein